MLLPPKTFASGVGLLLVVVLAIALVRPEPARGAGTAPVTVMNTPLPVQLAGSVTGIVQAVQSGSWTVGLNPDTALWTRDLDNPARQPFHFTGSFTVPEGKTYVVEHYSGECTGVDAVASLTSVRLIVVYDGIAARDYAVPHLLDSNGSLNGRAVNIWAGSGNTRLYAPGGAYIEVATGINYNASGGGRGSCTTEATGYVIDVP
jgi:hypothetical protein